MSIYDEIVAEACARVDAQHRAAMKRMLWEGDPTIHHATAETRRAVSEVYGAPESILFEPLPPSPLTVHNLVTSYTVTAAELEVSDG